MIASDKPSPILVAKGLSPVATEDQVTELFRQFALVKSVKIVRDPVTGMSKGIVLVEFFSVDYASHTLAHSADLQFERRPLRVQYAKDSFVTSVFTQQQQYAMQNAYAAAALQAAAWSQPQQMTYPPGIDPNATYSVQQQTPLQRPATATQIPIIPKTKSIWPLPFDTHGGVYSFQTASGCFLEASTGFYYCPKSKLYYNSSDGIYYKHNPLLNPQFTQFVPPLPVAEVVASEAPATSADNNAIRKPVTMSLGGQAAKAKVAKIFKQPSEDDEDLVIINNVPVQHLPGSKKSTIDDTRKREEAAKHGTTKHPTVPSATAQVPSSGGGGHPCMLCKRQFPSAELLSRHEKESKLHADNLLKLQQQQQQTTGEQKEPSGPVYKDRAAERRAM